MTIQSFSNENRRLLDFTSIMEKDRYELFQIISSNLQPQDYLNFLCTSKMIYEIDSKLKKDEKISYYNLFIKVLSNKLIDIPISELSTTLINYCKKAGETKCNSDKKEVFIKFKDFFNSLIVSGQFKRIPPETLEQGFKFCCIYNHSDMARLFINSSRFKDLSVGALEIAFVLSGSNEGEETRTLIDNNRFKKISREALGNLLKTASTNRYLGTVKAIIECSRANEISVKDYTESLYCAASNGSFTDEIENKIEILRTLINFPKFNQVTQESLVEIMISSARNWRGREVVELIQASNFNQISLQQLNEIFSVCVDRFQPISVKFFLESNRFHEITAENLGKVLQESAQYKDSEVLQTIVSNDRFNEIHLQDFIKAMHKTCGIGFNNVDTIPIESLQTLLDSPRFAELDSQVLQNIMETALSAKRVDPIRPQYDYYRTDALELLCQYWDKVTS
ncbi:MAG: hypothetical protein ACRCSV_01850 [Chlamydiales bacterium]